MGKIFPKNSPKMGVNRQFQAKTAKSLHCNIARQNIAITFGVEKLEWCG